MPKYDISFHPSLRPMIPDLIHWTPLILKKTLIEIKEVNLEPPISGEARAQDELCFGKKMLDIDVGFHPSWNFSEAKWEDLQKLLQKNCVSWILGNVDRIEDFRAEWDVRLRVYELSRPAG